MAWMFTSSPRMTTYWKISQTTMQYFLHFTFVEVFEDVLHASQLVERGHVIRLPSSRLRRGFTRRFLCQGFVRGCRRESLEENNEIKNSRFPTFFGGRQTIVVQGIGLNMCTCVSSGQGDGLACVLGGLAFQCLFRVDVSMCFRRYAQRLHEYRKYAVILCCLSLV